MKILVLTDRYPPYYEGAYELMCYQITEGLRARGHQVNVLTTTFGLTTKKSVEGHVYRSLNFLAPVNGGGFHRRLQQLQYFSQAQYNYRVTHTLVEELNPDLVFIWNIEGASILPILAVQDAGKQIVFTLGSHWLVHLKKEYVGESNRWRKWYRSALINFRRFEELQLDSAIVVSQSLKKSYLQAGFNIASFNVIPNGLSDDFIPSQDSIRHRTPEDPLRLLFVGRLEAEKGPDIAIRAVDYLVNVGGYNNVTLDLVGRQQNAYAEMLEQFIAQKGLQRIVRLVDFLPRSELFQLYPEYDVLLFPSLRWEGHPVAVLEAMAQGLTVIASDIGGPKDIIQHEQNGLLALPNKPIQLAKGIERLIREPSLSISLGRAAVETVRQKHTAEHMLDQYEIFLKQSLGQLA